MGTDQVQMIAAEADATRDRIAATFDELQDRLSPRALVNNAIGSVSDAGNELADTAKDVLRGHPVALALGALALGAALFGRQQLRHATLDLGDDLGGYTDYDDGYEPALDMPEPPRAAPARLAAAGSQITGVVEDNPLGALLAGLAAGALLGALFPSTETENRLLGASGARLGAAAKAAARAARGQLDAHGLGTGDAKAAA